MLYSHNRGSVVIWPQWFRHRALDLSAALYLYQLHRSVIRCVLRTICDASLCSEQKSRACRAKETGAGEQRYRFHHFELSQDFQGFVVQKLSEHDVLAIEMGCFGYCDEELRSICVGPLVRHRQLPCRRVCEGKPLIIKSEKSNPTFDS